MANSLLKLTVESSEYDAKLKKAAEGVRHLADVAHKSAGDMTGLEQSTLDYIKSIGEMETKSRSAAGQVRELESTYKELKVIYDQLNDVEKADEGGKALAASLEQLKQRTNDAKKSLDDASKSLQQNEDEGNKTSGVLDQLAQKFTVNIDALKLFDIGLKAAGTVLDVAKEAFFASEANVDEWGRTVAASESIYQGFLTSLNTGDISGFLSNIDQIVTAARAAYNELDRLGTMRTIQGPQMSAQQTENERMRMMIQTGRYIAPVDGRRATMQSGQLLTPEQIRRIEQQLQNGMKTVVGLVGNEVKQTGKAIDAVYDRQAKELGMSLKEFRKGTSSMAEFDKRMEGFANYQKWRSENYYTDNWGNRRVKEGNPYQDFAKWGTFRVDGQRYNDLVRLIQQRDQQASQAYGTMSQAYRTMNRAEGITVRQLMGGGSGSGSGGGKSTTTVVKPEEIFPVGSLKDLQQQMQELKKAQDLVTTPDAWREYQAQIDEIAIKIGQMTGKIGSLKPGDIQTTGLGSLANPFAGDSKKTGGLKLTLDDKAMKSVMQGVQKSLPKALTTEQKIDGMRDLVGGVNGVLSGIEQMGIEIPNEIKQVMGVLNGIFTIVGSIESIVVTGAILGLFSRGGVVPHAANGFAGTVPGNHFSGDVIPIMANAGEVVLNRAQAGVLANQLEGGGQRGGYTPSHVSGEQIWIALNAYTRRTGKGELVTWR